MSFSGLNQVLLPLLDALPQLPAVHRDALNVALGFGEGAPPSRLVVSNAALVLLRQAAAARPLLVIIDDLPWLDRASAGVLSFVARRLEGSRIGFLGASRTGGGELLRSQRPPGARGRARLTTWRHGSCWTSASPTSTSTVRERILVEAQGNPLALLELPVALGSRREGIGQGIAARAPAWTPAPGALPISNHRAAASNAEAPAAHGPRWHRRRACAGGGRSRDGGMSRPRTGRAGAPGVPRRGDPPARVPPPPHALGRRGACAGARSVEPPTACSPTCGRVSRIAGHGISPRRPSSRTSRWPPQLEAAAARILARGDAVGCVKALTRSADLSPGDAERGRRLAAAAYIGADVAGDLSNASQVLAELRRGDTEVEGSLQAAVAASAFLLQGRRGRRDRPSCAGRVRSRAARAILDARDPVVAEALYSLMMVCTYGGEEDLWRSFEDAMARSDAIPLAIDLCSKTFADPAHAGGGSARGARLGDRGAARRSGPDPDHPDRDRGHLRRPARRDVETPCGASSTTRVAVARSHQASPRWSCWPETISRRAIGMRPSNWLDEAIRVCEAHGYQALIWPCRYLQAMVAAGQGDDERAGELADEIIQWAAPRGIRVGEWFAWQVRGLAALGRGDFEEAYQLTSMISPPGLLAPHVPYALYVLMDLVEAAVRTGRDAEAAAHVAAMRAGEPRCPVAAPRAGRRRMRRDGRAGRRPRWRCSRRRWRSPGSSGGSSTSPGCGWPTANACGANARWSSLVSSSTPRWRSSSASAPGRGWTARPPSFGHPGRPSRGPATTSWTGSPPRSSRS